MLYCYMKAVSRTCETTRPSLHKTTQFYSWIRLLAGFSDWFLSVFPMENSTFSIFWKSNVSNVSEMCYKIQYVGTKYNMAVFILEFNSDFSLKIFLVNIRSSISVIPKKYTHTYFHDKVTISTRKKCDENLQKINLIQLRN